MADLTRSQMIELIAGEVLKELGRKEAGPVKEEEHSKEPAKQPVLVAGDIQKLPCDVKERYDCRGMNEYEGDIRGFEKIFITELSMTELADIALGRNTKTAQCAVINGLLYGREVFMYDFAPEHRKLSVSAETPFYRMLEGYVKRLGELGVKSASEKSCGSKTPPAAGRKLRSGGVVTEERAKELVKAEAGAIVLKKGTVITPSAKDIFYREGRELRFVESQKEGIDL